MRLKPPNPRRSCPRACGHHSDWCPRLASLLIAGRRRWMQTAGRCKRRSCGCRPLSAAARRDGISRTRRTLRLSCRCVHTHQQTICASHTRSQRKQTHRQYFERSRALTSHVPCVVLRGRGYTEGTTRLPGRRQTAGGQRGRSPRRRPSSTWSCETRHPAAFFLPPPLPHAPCGLLSVCLHFLPSISAQ